MLKSKNQKTDYTIMPNLTVIPSSGNIYADLGYPNPNEAMAKAKLVILIADTLKKKKLSTGKVAKLMGIDHLQLLAILTGRISEFTLEELCLIKSKL